MSGTSISIYSRRDLLKRTALLPALTCLHCSAGAASEMAAAVRKPPYAALESFITPGHDEFGNEKAAFAHEAALTKALASFLLPLAPGAQGWSPQPMRYRPMGPDVRVADYSHVPSDLAAGWREWIHSLGQVERAAVFCLPENRVRYEVASQTRSGLEYRIGYWQIEWTDDDRIQTFHPLSEEVVSAAEPWFRDVTAHAFGPSSSGAADQFSKGVPYWRTVLDPASGMDLYGSNGIAVGDIDNDGLDEVYVCQGGGLPNRLLKIGLDGSVIDWTASWQAGLLDDTSSALFVDLRNIGRQDLVVLRSSGPLLFLNEGTHFRLREDAFQFAEAPRGGFTGMAAADFDRDGKLDLYLCCYVYFQSEAQYTYAAPYHDAQNGPPNFLFRNRLAADGSGNLIDCTSETGMMENNNRFSFAPAWCDYNDDGWPDLYVANDFGRKNLYRNREGHFHDIAQEAGVEDIGPGMSASWFDYDADGKPDLYVANMWTAAGQRTIADPAFKPALKQADAYRAHTMGNSLFANRGKDRFEDVTASESVAFGRWAWGSGGHDLDNDGVPELLVTCGMLTNGQSGDDLGSFFWRQVVARSPATAAPSSSYENGWNAINQFVREDRSWNGHEPNVVHARRNGRFYDFSGVSGFDFANDSRAFAVLDFDGDGRPDILLKSRLGPQLRLLQNNVAPPNSSIAFRLQGTKSNRDAIGTKVEVDGLTKWLEAGSGFLSQHSKQLSFGLDSSFLPESTLESKKVGSNFHPPEHTAAPLASNLQHPKRAKSVRITWPSGTVQQWHDLEIGFVFSIVEGQETASKQPFGPVRRWPEGALSPQNSLELRDAWFLSSVPLPQKQEGPGLFTVQERTPEYEVFRRYLFDYRAPLQPPLALFLNGSGEAVKVYAKPPSEATVRNDKQLWNTGKCQPLPFKGFYVKQPGRDFFKFGAAYLWAGMPNQALPYLQRVLVDSPDNTRVLTLIGQIYLEQDRLDLAEAEFRKASQLVPDAPNAWIGLGDVANRQNRLSEAAEHYRKAKKLDGQSPEAANALGLVSAKLGQTAEAQTEFERAIELRRDYAEAINNLGVLFMQSGKPNDAIAAWTYGIKAAPGSEILYLNLGRAYISTGHTDRAREIMQQLLDHDKNNQTARRALQELSSR